MIYYELTPEFEMLCWANGIDISKMPKGIFTEFVAAVPVVKFSAVYDRDLFFINGQQYAFVFKKGNFSDVYFGQEIEGVMWFDRPIYEFIELLLDGGQYQFDEGFFNATIGTISK